jgi:trehalose-6-phosphate synthase
MKRFYLNWISALFLAALSVGFIQGYVEQRHWLANERSKSMTLAQGLVEGVASQLSARSPSHLGKTLKRLQLASSLAGIAVCAYDVRDPRKPLFLARQSIGSPDLGLGNDVGNDRSSNTGVDWRTLCENAEKIASSPAKAESSLVYNHARTKILSVFHRIDTSDLPAAIQRKFVFRTYSLAIARDVSYLHEAWVSAWVQGFLITFLLGAALLIMVATQMRRWLYRRIGSMQANLRAAIAGSRERQRLAPPILAELPAPDLRKNLVVISNREPYIHRRIDAKSAGKPSIELMRPASGLVTALEPILRQRGGLWIAHGSGSADFDMTDSHDEIAVPPEKPSYRLRRVHLTQEQEEGYYYGFSNEGLWPLCHLAHTRPVFRLNDWKQYEAVNRVFCNAIPSENFNASVEQESLFLVQDYHFGLLPKMIQERAVSLGAKPPKIGIFWHIPWPNPEAFGICPWNKELLRGMLGANVIGFHTQFHCNNFLEACNRYLEARIDYEHFSVTMDRHETMVRAFPIGIDTKPVETIDEAERERLKAKYGIHAEFIAVGVDRIDYTKGIVERIEAVERFLDKYPEYIGRFSLVQMSAPSRTSIPAYRRLFEDLEEVVARVNARFSSSSTSTGAEDYKPIVFIPTHHEWKDIQYFYQLGDVCMVTSLHDGMNLVAKEYVWCQAPERGALILSKFTGASRELTEAFIVNPYSTEETADALYHALNLAPEEKAVRMVAMREKVRSHNAYQWASELIEALPLGGLLG